MNHREDLQILCINQELINPGTSEIRGDIETSMGTSLVIPQNLRNLVKVMFSKRNDFVSHVVEWTESIKSFVKPAANLLAVVERRGSGRTLHVAT